MFNLKLKKYSAYSKYTRANCIKSLPKNVQEPSLIESGIKTAPRTTSDRIRYKDSTKVIERLNQVTRQHKGDWNVSSGKKTAKYD